MIQSIFLIEWEDFLPDYLLVDLNGSQNSSFVKNPKFLYFYPQNNDTFNNYYTINRLLNPHKADIEYYYNNQNQFKDLYNDSLKHLKRRHIVVQEIYDHVVITIYIIPNRLMGLVFEKTDDPSLYMEDLEADLELFVYLNLKNFNNSRDSVIETVLSSIFVDMRSVFHLKSDEIIHILNPSFIRSQLEEYYKSKFIKVYIYGLDNAGKSSLMRFIKTGNFDHNYFLPTKRYAIHKLILPNNVRIACWEMPGQKIFRKSWIRSLKGTDLLVFVLDSADRKRFQEAKDAFWSIAERSEVRDKPIVFIANKIDLVENKKELNEIEEYFSLNELSERKWTLKFISLVTKEGIKELIKWIADTIEEDVIKEIFEMEI
ncbi:MAG: ADP-ribosylation factor-like protein [Promethearchaeota archaeon]